MVLEARADRPGRGAGRASRRGYNEALTMCEIAGILSLRGQPLPELSSELPVMDDLLRHRGTDGSA